MLGAVSTSEIMDDNNDDELGSTELAHAHHTTQILLTTKPPVHVPEAGLNPLVDAASYAFSLMGKLQHTKHYKNLAKLHNDLIHEIENFRETIQSYSYKADYVDEYMLISCFALCSALDNIISNTTWGNMGKWHQYSLVNAYKQASLSHENILIILERLVGAPDIYIDVMEFIYICLNLGLTFKQLGQYTEFSTEQLEQITCSLYKRIRTYRGNYNKTLSPFSIKSLIRDAHFPLKTTSKWLNLVVVCSFLAATLAGVNYWVDQQMGQPTPRLSLTELSDHGSHTTLHASNKKIANSLAAPKSDA